MSVNDVFCWLYVGGVNEHDNSSLTTTTIGCEPEMRLLEWACVLSASRLGIARGRWLLARGVSAKKIRCEHFTATDVLAEEASIIGRLGVKGAKREIIREAVRINES